MVIFKRNLIYIEDAEGGDKIDTKQHVHRRIFSEYV